MSIPLFGLNISKLLYDAIQTAGGLRDIVLIKTIAGTLNPNDLTGGVPVTQTRHNCEGFLSITTDTYREGTLVRAGGESVVILGESLTGTIRPRPGDKCELEGKQFAIGAVSNDPAEATFTCAVNLLETVSGEAPVVVKGAFSSAFDNAFDTDRLV